MELKTALDGRGFGVIPWFNDIGMLPAEDAVDLEQNAGDGAFHIACPMLSRIANFDDLGSAFGRAVRAADNGAAGAGLAGRCGPCDLAGDQVDAG